MAVTVAVAVVMTMVLGRGADGVEARQGRARTGPRGLPASWVGHIVGRRGAARPVGGCARVAHMP